MKKYPYFRNVIKAIKNTGKQIKMFRPKKGVSYFILQIKKENLQIKKHQKLMFSFINRLEQEYKNENQ